MIFDENFAFDSTPRSPSLSSDLSNPTRDHSRAVSPCTAGTTTAYPLPQISVIDLAACFATSRLRNDSQICYDSCEAYANMEDDADWQIPAIEETYLTASGLRKSPARAHSSSRRKARQFNARLLCSSSHVQDIADLVSRMVDRKEHCNLVDSPDSVLKSVEVVGDEAYVGEISAAASRRSSLAVQRSRMDYARTSDYRSASGARVCKTTRQKKDVKLGRLRSGESDAH